MEVLPHSRVGLLRGPGSHITRPVGGVGRARHPSFGLAGSDPAWWSRGGVGGREAARRRQSDGWGGFERSSGKGDRGGPLRRRPRVSGRANGTGSARYGGGLFAFARGRPSWPVHAQWAGDVCNRIDGSSPILPKDFAGTVPGVPRARSLAPSGHQKAAHGGHSRGGRGRGAGCRSSPPQRLCQGSRRATCWQADRQGVELGHHGRGPAWASGGGQPPGRVRSQAADLPPA